MCGITGFFSYKNKINTKKYYDAHIKLAHRGPDDEGFIYKNTDNTIEHLVGNDTIDELKSKDFLYNKQDSSMILGHRRLSIIDLTSAGHQPYTFNNLSLVYNGEIYNYIELRDELKELGYSFKTNSDTEVFLKAYHCWGVDAFNKFNGMWASAIYDKEKDTILLTRDRFGIKPLYYSLIDDNLIFGSEIKFVSSFMDKLEVNEQMVYEYLRFIYLSHGEETLFKNIYQLEPNSYMVYSDSKIEIKQYWDLSSETNVSKNIIEEKLKKSIDLRLRSDVEVGSLLSGGIDSSTILGIIDEENSVKNFQTFSAAFKEEDYSEKKYIDHFYTKNINLKKHFIYPSPENLLKTIDQLLYTQEVPIRSLTPFSQNEIYKYIKQNTNVKVLLNGQGADEIFTGYVVYYYSYLLELLRTFEIKSFFREYRCLKKNRKLSDKTMIKRLVIELFGIYYRRNDKYNLFKKPFQYKKRRKPFRNYLKNSLWEGLTYSALREYLEYEDKNSMNYSLESRLPFLDFNLVQSAFSLENNQKIKDGVSKYTLREIAKNIIPLETLLRKDKMGFISPQEEWQKTIFKEEFDFVFQEIELNGLFNLIDNKKAVELYNNYKKGNFKDWSLIWRLYCLYKWKCVWKIK